MQGKWNFFKIDIDFYKEKNLLSTVDGTKAINEVFNDICELFGRVD